MQTIVCPSCLAVQIFRPEQAEGMTYKCANCDKKINAWKIATQLKPSYQEGKK